ncbi:MAG TPA: hypothetical protein VGI20_07605, partial [Rhizomicrobium sp.]
REPEQRRREIDRRGKCPPGREAALGLLKRLLEVMRGGGAFSLIPSSAGRRHSSGWTSQEAPLKRRNSTRFATIIQSATWDKVEARAQAGS